MPTGARGEQLSGNADAMLLREVDDRIGVTKEIVARLYDRRVVVLHGGMLRMKRAGSRWKEPTSQHIVRFRALNLSERWDSALEYVHARNRTAVRKVA